MTQWTDARIPIWVPPLPGEALDSWLEAYARRLRVSAAEFLDLVGVPAAKPRLMVRQLTAEESSVLSARTGLAADCLREMTLEPWDGLVISIGAENRRLLRPPAWRRYGKDTRYCPACLSENEGRWPLTWRLPWTFACTRHNLLLLDRCAVCGQRPPVHSRHRHRPSLPGTCLAAAGARTAGERCGAQLDQAVTVEAPPDGLILSAQRQVDEALLISRLATEKSKERAQEIYRLARKTLKCISLSLDTAPKAIHDILAEAGGRLPEFANPHQGNDSHGTAVGVAAAQLVLDTEHPPSEEVFSWLVSTDFASWSRTAAISWLQDAWLPIGPRVAARAAAHADSRLPLRTRIRHGTTTPKPTWTTATDEDVQLRASRVPAMLWPSWTMRLLPTSTSAPTLTAGFRRACVILMLLHGSACDQQQAAVLLGTGRPRAQRAAFDKVLDGHDCRTLITVLVQLARNLDQTSPPINYARRRALFNEATLIFEEDAYQQLCLRHVISSPHSDYMRWHLLKLLRGSDPGDSPRTPAAQAKFRHRLTAPFTAFLQQQAVVNLHAHGLSEPVQWEPPLDWVDALDWPGTLSETLGPAQLTGRFSTALPPAARLEASLLHLREETTGMSTRSPARPPGRAPGHRVPREGPLAPDQLRKLYEEQQLELKQIATLADCGIRAVRNALRDAEIPLRFRRAPGSLERSVTPEWLRTEYQLKGRSTPDIARELGVRTPAILKLMRKWDITRDAHSSNPFASLSIPLSPAMTKVAATKNCLQRLQRITQMPGHQSLSAAARAQGVGLDSLCYQLRSIEKTAGFSIIATTSPVATTPAGHSLLTEAEHLLHRLAEHTE
ncbi:TniQ family protein [Streptomyces sp. NPDC090741]|uniref:TniQ family protein n=1 Tax=Streptomyces sp. NPDC090741 TaxID=3365967 RepID=UPI0038233041